MCKCTNFSVARESESEYELPDRESSSESAEVPNSPPQITTTDIAYASDSSK